MKTVASKDSQNSHVPTGATPAPLDEAVARVPNGTSAATADPPPHPDAPATPPASSPHIAHPQPAVTTPPVRRYRKWLLLAGALAALAVGGYFLAPWVEYGTEHGEHRGRLRQRSRDLRGPAGIRPGDEGAGQ